jgi:DNA-binding transcriptional LysR family regulator
VDIDILREFVELANSLNFTETANKMYISRSVLSKHISMLESELGASLFVRSTHKVYLTDIGKLFLSNIKTVIQEYDSAASKVSQSLSLTGGELHIGFLDAAFRPILIPSVKKFRTMYPNTKLYMTSYELGELDKDIRENKVDLALTILFTISVLGDEWAFKELYTDGFAAMVPLTSPLACKTSIKYAELRDEELILPNPERYPVMAQLLQQIGEKSGFFNKPYAEYSHIDAASIMVEGGSACFIVPKHCEIFPHSNSCFIDLEDEEALIRVGALWRSTNSNPFVPHFIKILSNFTDSV